MIESIEMLWFLMTVFFTESVVDFSMFQAMFLLNIVFGVCYLLKYIFDELKRL